MRRKLIYLSSFILVLGVAASTVVAELVAYYPLDEGTGTIAGDTSGNGHNGTLNNGTTWISPGYMGNSAINVDGNAGSRVDIGTWDPSEGTGQLSLALWVKWSGEQNKSDHQGLIGKRDSWSDTGALRWFLEVRNDGRIHMRNYNQGVAAPAGTLDPFINQWAHIAVTFDGTTARIYLNGEEQASGEFSLHDKTDAAMGIGCTHGGNDGNQEVFSGDLDEVYIFNNPISQAQIQDLANGIVPTFPKARWPQPEDDATLRDTWASFSWKAGDGAASHDLYLGESFADVNEGTGETFRGNQTGLFFIAGFPGYPYPDGLVPDTTYYWRVDEVEADGVTKHKGDVWSFFISPKKAYDPNPMDGAALIATDVTLSYSPGFGVKLHHVYFGENFADVEAGTPDTYKGPAAVTSFVPGTLEFNATYYWRIDEFDGFTTHTGDVWSFQTTQPGLGTIVLEIWENITGSSVDNLRDDPRYPDQPDSTQPVTELAWDPDMDNYGGRIHGWLYAPLTGDYTFWLTSDNSGELWLSTNDDPENIELIANISGWAGANEWIKFGSQKSAPISLTAGNKYYIMALWKEQDGGDHCKVAWQGPGISTRTIIPGSYLSPYEPVKAYGPSPGDGSTGAKRTPTLSWKPGDQASSHEVYFGTDEDAVKNATTASPEYKDTKALGSESYDPGKLAWESTYYWRVDEVNSLNPDSPWVGSVWSFTTADFIGIEDFEDYNDWEPDRIFETWIDGWGTTTNGSTVGYPDPNFDQGEHFVETDIVHGGSQSMPYFYENNFKYSEATLTLVSARDWTEEGVGVLSLWFYGDASNVAERMYLAINGIATVYHDNPDPALIDEWTEWTIDLQEFADQGVNLANVNMISIGFGDKNNLQAGGSGLVFFDDIRLYRPAEPEPEPAP